MTLRTPEAHVHRLHLAVWLAGAIVVICLGVRPLLGDVSGTAAARTPSSAPPTPGKSWEKVSPATVGLDAAKLNRIAAQARRGRSNCLVVVRDGRLAGEWYFNRTGPNSEQEVWSVTKSIASTLVGIAQGDGDLRIRQSASTWIREWRGSPSAAVTVRNLLSMDSGREWSVLNDYVQFGAAEDRTGYAIGLGQAAPPGTVWVYNNAAVQTLERVLEQAIGRNVAAFARQRLFGPLGMAHTTMTTDRAGNPQLAFGVQSTCRDLARLGLLMLNEGRWGDRQVVSPAWVRQATATSTKLNAGYGYLWWLNREGVRIAPPSSEQPTGTPARGRLVPAAPRSMFWAIGLGNQLIQVDPGSKTVVVRLGAGGTFGPAVASKVVTDAVVRR